MRIFLALHPSGNLSVPGSLTWYQNFYKPLIDIGHEVVLLRMDEVAQKYNVPFRGRSFKEIFNNELLTTFLKENDKSAFDLFLSYFTELDISTETIKLLKRTGVPLANYSCNNTHQFHLVKEISPLFDYNLYSEKDAETKFKAIGANNVWFPMAANPQHYHPIVCDYIYDVSFIGAAYAKRAFYVNFLANQNHNVDCFGPNWLINKPFSNIKKIKKEFERIYKLAMSLIQFNPVMRYKISSDIQNYDLLNALRKLNRRHFHYPVSDHEMISIINQSRINLGFLEVYSYNNVPGSFTKQHIHLREFEVPMCGGLYITNYTKELEEFYELGKEIDTFRNEYELTDKIMFYLNNEKASMNMRKAAYLRATSCHTYQKRFSDLFNKLKL